MWNVYSDVATAGTTLTETVAMPESQYTITQGTLTINELITDDYFVAKAA